LVLQRRWPRAGASANDELAKMQQNPKDWVMPAGNYNNQRYSELKADHPRECRQIAGGVDVLGPACCVATKVDR